MTTIAQTVSDPELSDKHPAVHPLIHAGRAFMADMFSTLLFVALFAITKDVFLATGLAIVGGVIQIAWLKLRGSSIDAMQWMSLVLVVVFGGASLFTHDPHFVMLKVSLIKCAIGAVMLCRGWIIRYIPPEGVKWSSDVAIVFGYIWAGLMFFTAALNVVMVYTVDVKTWAWFVGVFPTSSMIGLFAVQYLVMHWIGIRRARAAGAAL